MGRLAAALILLALGLTTLEVSLAALRNGAPQAALGLKDPGGLPGGCPGLVPAGDESSARPARWPARPVDLRAAFAVLRAALPAG